MTRTPQVPARDAAGRDRDSQVNTPGTLGGVTPRSRPDDQSASAEVLPDGQVAELPPGSAGVWRITTNKSVHVIDLDAVPPTYQRLPGEKSRSFDTDDRVHELTRVDLWPTLGWRFVFRFQDPMRPHQGERRHATSPVQRIESIREASSAGEAGPSQV